MKPAWRRWLLVCSRAGVKKRAEGSWVKAIGLFSGYQAAKASTGILVTLSALALSDAVLGFYSGFWYVYAAALIPVFLGKLIRDRSGAGVIAAAAFASSLSFFLITNFMVWATGNMYPHTIGGLSACFLAGIPFYRNQILGDAFYTAAIFGGYALIHRIYQPTGEAA